MAGNAALCVADLISGLRADRSLGIDHVSTATRTPALRLAMVFARGVVLVSMDLLDRESAARLRAGARHAAGRRQLVVREQSKCHLAWLRRSGDHFLFYPQNH